jgi:hypothetical protein
VVNNALRYRAQAPLLDSLLKEIGLDGSDINALVKGVTPQPSAPQLDSVTNDATHS